MAMAAFTPITDITSLTLRPPYLYILTSLTTADGNTFYQTFLANGTTTAPALSPVTLPLWTTLTLNNLATGY